MSQFVFKGKIPNTKSLKSSPLLLYYIYTPFVDKQDQYFGKQIKFSVKSMSLQSEHIFLLIFPLKRWIEPLLILEFNKSLNICQCSLRTIETWQFQACFSE